MEEFITSWEFWLIVAAVCVILELITNTFAMFAVAGGCVVALVLSVLDCGLPTQLFGLCVGTVITFICFKPLIRKHVQFTDTPEFKSNIDALTGREVFAFENSDEDGVTRIRIDGDNWQVRTQDRIKIKKGDRLRITGHDSIVLIAEIAEKVENTDN